MDNLPMIRNNTFFAKIKNFFRRLFGKKNDVSNDISNEIPNGINEENIINEITKKDDFLEEYKKANAEKNLKEEIFQRVRQNPELKKTLSDKRLEQLIEIYNEKLKIVREENMQLRKRIEKLQEIIKKES